MTVDIEIFMVWDNVGPGEPVKYFTTIELARAYANAANEKFKAEVESGVSSIKEYWERFIVQKETVHSSL